MLLLGELNWDWEDFKNSDDHDEVKEPGLSFLSPVDEASVELALCCC